MHKEGDGIRAGRLNKAVGRLKGQVGDFMAGASSSCMGPMHPNLQVPSFMMPSDSSCVQLSNSGDLE